MAESGKMSFELWMKEKVSDELKKIYEHFQKIDTKAEETIQILKKFNRIVTAGGNEIAGDKVYVHFNKIERAILQVSEKYDSLKAKFRDSPIGANRNMLLRPMQELKTGLEEMQRLVKDPKMFLDKQVVNQIITNTRTLLAEVGRTEKAYDREAKAVQRSNKEKERANRQNTAAKLRDEAAAMDSVRRAIEKVTSAGEKQGRMWGELKGMLAAYVSVQGLSQFAKDLITVGGEFEVQRVALQNILGDLSKANEVYNQIKDLAVVSPFSFRQLSTYTKQTAAFGIPSNELFDVTKRLADLSAGLGVDMNRLILAFGQVRSAAILRGQELRQFTEAGIPLVAELAKKFTELNGKATSTAEVFDLISKRQVSFEMVRDILWEMTDEGGRFADMQLKLSDTLAGKWSNLQDAWEIAMSEVANSSTLSGKALKGIITLVTELISHVNTLVPLIAGIGVGESIGSIAKGVSSLGVGNIEKQIVDAQRLVQIELRRQLINGSITREQYSQRLALAGNKAQYYNIMALEGKMNAFQLRRLLNQQKLDAATIKQLARMKLITLEEAKIALGGGKIALSWKAIGDAIKGAMGPLGWIQLAIEAIATAFFFWKQSSDETTEAVNNHIDSTKEKAEELKSVLESIGKNAPTDTKGYISAIDSISESMKSALPDSVYKEIFSKANKITDVAKKFDYLRNSLEDVTRAYEMVGEGSAGFRQLLDETDGVLTEKMSTNLKDFSEASGDLNKALTDLAASGGENLRQKLLEIAETVPSLKAAFDDGSENGRSLKDALDEFFMGFKDAEDLGWKSWGLGYKSDAIESIWTHIDGKDQVAFSNAVEKAKERAEKYHDLQWQIEKVQEYVIKQMAVSYGVTAEQMEQDIKAETERNGHQMGMEARAMFRKVMNDIGVYGAELENYLRTHPIKLGFVYNVTELVDIQTSISEFTKQILTKLGFNAYKGTRISFGPEKDLKEAPEWVVSDINQSGGSVVNLADIWGKRIKTAAEDRKKAEKLGNAAKEEAKKAAETEKEVRAAYKQFFGVDFVDEKEQKKNDAAKRKADAARSNQETEARKREQKFLKTIKDRLSQYKKFRQELEAEAKLVGENNAFNFLKESDDFKELFNYFKALGATDEQIKDYREAVKRIAAPISGGNMNTDERKNIVSGAAADVASFETKERRTNIDNINTALRTQLGIIKEQYDTYKKLIELMSADEAARIAFGGNFGSPSYKEYLEKQMSEALAKIPNSNYTASQVLSMDKGTFNKAFGEKSETISELYTAYQEETNRLQKESLDLITDTIKSHRVLEQKIEDENRIYARQLEIIRSAKNLSPAMREEAEQTLNKTHLEKTGKLELELFKKNNEWQIIFDNLDAVSSRTLNEMIAKVENFSKTTGLGTEEVNTLRKALEKLREEQGERNPLKGIKEGYSTSNFLRGILTNPFRQTEDGKYRITDTDANRYGVKAGNYSRAEIEVAIANADKQMLKGVQGLEKGFKALQGVLQPVIDLFDTLGMGDNPLSELLNMGSSALGTASSTLGNFNTMKDMANGIFGEGSAIGKALGNAGPWAAAAGAGLSLITSIAALHDKALQKEIEASQQRQKEAENVQKNLEGTLARILGGVYTMLSPDSLLARLDKGIYKNGYTYDASTGKWVQGKTRRKGISQQTEDAYKEAKESRTYYDAMFAAQSAQLDELKLQYTDAQKMKKKDQSQIADLENQIYEAEEALKSFASDMAKALYDIDVKSWASDLTDAIVDAWASGEDAVKAYHDKAAELVKDLTKNILAQKVMEVALEPVQKAIEEEMTAKNGRLDEASVSRIYGLLYGADGAVQTVVDSLEALKAGGVDLSDAVSESGLSGDIKNIQESTADLLASYINAIRADVFAQRTDVSDIRTAVFSIADRQNVIAEAQTRQMEQIAANTLRNAEAAERIETVLTRAQRDSGFGFYMR